MSHTHVLNPVEFEVNGHKIHGLSNGNIQAPLLLCLHGWLDNAASFLPMMPCLSDYHVVAIDWPGHGLSDHRSKDAHYHFIDWIYDLISLIRSKQWQKIDIVGHSMGAMVASAFSAAFGEHVRSLTLIDSIGLLTADESTTTQQMRKGLLSRLSQNHKTIKYHPSIDSAVAARVSVSDLTAEHAQLIVKRGIDQTSKGFTWRSDNRLRAVSPYRFTQSQAKQLVGDINVPTQLIYGSRGMAMVAQGIASFSSLIKGLQIHQLEGGHHVHMEQATLTAKLIAQFIEQQN